MFIANIKSKVRKIPYARDIARIARTKFLFSVKGSRYKKHRKFLDEKITSNDFLPRIIHIETRSMCNGKCSFCAAAVQFGSRPDVWMQDELIDKILDELSDLEYSNRISFYSNNEPYLDKRIYDLIYKARRKLPEAFLELKTNGVVLNWEKVIKSFDNGLDYLHITDYLPDIRDQHRKNIQKIVEKLSKTRRFQGEFDSKNDKARIKISKRYVGEVLRTRAGSAPNAKALKEPLNKPCYRPVEMLTIDPSGKVGICSEDVMFEETMGDVNKNSISEIWRSNEYVELRKQLHNGKRGYKSTCAACDYSGSSIEFSKSIE